MIRINQMELASGERSVTIIGTGPLVASDIEEYVTRVMAVFGYKLSYGGTINPTVALAPSQLTLSGLTEEDMKAIKAIAP